MKIVIRIWDLCRGTGQDTLARASMGHDPYASDGAQHGIARGFVADNADQCSTISFFVLAKSPARSR